MTVLEAEIETPARNLTRRSLRVVIPGGSGHLGTVLAAALHERGDDIVVVSRTPSLLPWRVVGWEELAAEVDGADVVINLAGRGVDCRYTAENKRQIMSSRIESTREVGRAIAAARRAPRVWLQMSTATIYAHRYDAPTTSARASSAATKTRRRRGASAPTSPRPGSAPPTKPRFPPRAQ